MRLEPLGEDPIELTTHQIADLYWDHHFASVSADREERLRVDRGDLRDAHRIVDAALANDAEFDQLLATLITVLKERYPADVSAGLGYLAAGPIEERWNSGDHLILERLRALDVTSDSIDRIEAGIWKSTTPPARPRAKPRHPE